MYWTWGRGQRLGALALAPASLCFIALRCVTSPDIAFIEGSEPWVMAPTTVSADLHQWGSDAVPATRFTRQFHVAAIDGPVVAEVRALRAFRLEVNGSPVPSDASALPQTIATLLDSAREIDWREPTRIDISPHLVLGENELAVSVSNARGPALLAVRVEGLADTGEPLVTDETWLATVEGGVTGAAIAATDTRANPAALTGVAPARAFAKRSDTALLLFVLGVLGLAGGRAILRARPAWQARLPAVAFGAGVLAWFVFLPSFLAIPLQVGFDARHHRDYVVHLRDAGTVPLATDGWSMFHPPLFYAATLVASAGDVGAAKAFRMVPFFAGLATVALVFACVRRLYPEAPRLQSFAVGFAALLPVNIYSSAYFSNESLHTALAAAALFGTVGLLLASRASLARVALLGALLGLALLTKFTAAVLVPIALFFLVCKQLALERASVSRVGAAVLAFSLPILALAGWYYVRNWMVFGDLFMANWGGMPGSGHTWWQQPGFRTLDYYTGFGASLTQPFLSGFESIWDSVYSTLWGDGFVAGRVSPSDRHPIWNYDFMAMAYWVSLPATALMLLGGVLAVDGALHDVDRNRRVALSFLTTTVWAVVFGFLYLSLLVPFYSQAKASYGLVLAPPLAIFFALGAERCDDALARPGKVWLALRGAFYGWLGLWLGVLLLSYAG